MHKILAWAILAALLSGCSLFNTGANPTPTFTPQPVGLEDVETGSVMVFWERSGGIAGICQQMTILPDSSYRIINCNNNEVVAEGQLDSPYKERISGLVTEFASLEWQTPQSELGPDAFLDKLTLNGTGTSQADGDGLDQELASMAQSLIRNK